MTLDREQWYKTVDSFDRKEVPDGCVIYDEQREQVHFLNPTAAAILELCEGGSDLRTIVAVMQEAFDLSTSPVVEVEACMASLLAQGLLERCDFESVAAARYEQDLREG